MTFADRERDYAPLYGVGAAVEDDLLARLDTLFATADEPPPSGEEEPPSTAPAWPPALEDRFPRNPHV